MRRSTRPGALALSAVLFLAGIPATAQPLAQRLAACFACHGADGSSRTPLVPSLGGQPGFFIIAQLFLFREGRRGTPMDAFAKGLGDAELSALADAVAALPPPQPPAARPVAARMARGRALVQRSNCMGCHNPDFSGGQQVPRIAHQREDYLLKALRDYRSGARIGYGMAVMGEALHGIGDAELADVAHFLAHLPPPAARGK